MFKPQTFAAFGLAPGGLLVCCLLLSGCEKAEQITFDTVSKHESLQSSEFLVNYERSHPKPERMIGFIVPRTSALWFFKLQGNIEAVTARENDVREFLKSVQFLSDDKIEWVLPAGWQRLPGNEMRYATLVLNGQPSLEMSVTTFPSRPDLPHSDQVVQNINRWRGQLSLPPIDDEDLADQSEKLTQGGVIGYWTSLIGRPKPKPAAMAPPQRSQPVQQSSETAERGTEPTLPAYDTPAEWSEGPPAMFAVVSLQVADGETKAAITVTSARGNRLDNVNRWRGQVGLGPITEAELTSTAKKVEVGSLSGDLYEMAEGGRSIFGVIVEDRGQMWFVKLAGDTALAERERGRFEEFLKSLRLRD